MNMELKDNLTFEEKEGVVQFMTAGELLDAKLAAEVCHRMRCENSFYRIGKMQGVSLILMLTHFKVNEDNRWASADLFIMKKGGVIGDTCKRDKSGNYTPTCIRLMGKDILNAVLVDVIRVDAKPLQTLRGYIQGMSEGLKLALAERVAHLN